MVDAKQTVISMLRPSETAVLVLDTRPDGGASSASTIHRSTSSQSTRRVLAVITHETHDQKHSALFVYKWTRRDPPSLVLVTALPISPLLEISVVLLTSTGSLVSKDGKPSATTRSAIAMVDCLVDVRSDGKELSFVCNEASALALEQTVTSLKKLEVMEDESSERTHGWIAAYSHDDGERKLISQLRRAQDLRSLYYGPALSPARAGNPGDEDADISLIRSDWISKQVRRLREEYSTPHTIKLRVGTFNVNGKTPASSIRSWVCGSLEPSKDSGMDEANPDLFIFGFEELDLSTGALVYSTSTALEEVWTAAIVEALGSKAGSYVKFASKQLVGMLIVAFIRKGQRPYISEIAASSVGVGIMGVMGNKGGVGLRFRFRDTVICCVASHLAANDGLVEKRNSDYLEICHRLQFPLIAATPAEAAEQVQPISSSLFESDILIWMGDLNYRLDLPEDEVAAMIEPPMKPYNIATLMEYDELHHSKVHKLAFELFQEEPILFTPTYRYYVGTLSLDPRRRPAWTDRILHIAYPASSLQQLSYQSHPDITLSDHKPISADFNLETRSIDLELHSKTVAEVLKSVKDTETSEKSTSRIRPSSQQIDIGDVYYRDPITRTFELTNTGSRACSFRFLSQEEGIIAPKWLNIDLQYGFLLPQESITVLLTVNVDDYLAAELNSGSRSLEATLIVHPGHGADTFIAITGRFMPTCFARSLDALVHLPKPVRQCDGVPVLNDTRAANIPKELMRIIDWLMSNPLDERFEELFMTSSPLELLHSIRESLDTGEEFKFDAPSTWSSTQITLAFAETLTQFLASLTEPIVPTSFHPQIASGQEEDIAEFLDTMSHVSVNVWVTLFAFLQYECVRTEDRMPRLDRADAIAAVFAPALIRGDNKSPLLAPLTPLQKRRFVLRFIM